LTRRLGERDLLAPRTLGPDPLTRTLGHLPESPARPELVGIGLTYGPACFLLSPPRISMGTRNLIRPHWT